jgi:MoxR-like ATPase
MFTKELASTLATLFKQDSRNIVPFLQGPPGIGKTAIIAQAAREAGKNLITFALPTCESVDLRGLPTVVDGATRWASPLPKDGVGILLLDELASAAPDVQAASHHIVHAEQGSDMSLPLGWHIVLTGNRAVDKAHFRATAAPLRNRLTIIQAEADVKGWADWAMEHGIDPVVTAFLRWRPELLVTKEVPNEGGFPSPRAWEAVSNILSLTVNTSVEWEMILGTVGEGATTEFAAYLRTARELPGIEELVHNQAKAQVPTSPAQLYALTTCLAQYTREHQKSAMKYVSRMPAEFALLYINDIRSHYDIRKDKAVAEWIGKHKTLFAEAA